MNFINESERFFYFDNYTGPRLNLEGVLSKGNRIQFAKAEFRNYFQTAQACMEYINMITTKLKDFTPNSRVDKSFAIKYESVDVTDPEWELIKTFMPRPDKITPAMIRTWETQVANNFPDRGGDRFRKDALQSLAATLIGKGKLTGHDRVNPGDGMFYDAKIVPYTIDQTLAMLPSRSQKGVSERLKTIEQIDGAIYFAVAKFYKLNVTEQEQAECRQIDAGINKYLSVGFTVPAWEPVYDKSSDELKIMYYEFRNTETSEVECLEASSVGLGAQIGAQVTKSYFPGADFTEEIIETIVRKTVQSLQPPPPVLPESVPMPSDFDPLAYYYEIFDFQAKGETPDAQKAAWSAAYINDLEDNCFAAIEPSLEKDDAAKSIPRNARHLPHHAKGNGGAGTAGTLDLSHFDNAKARMGQIKAVTSNISTDDLRKKAENHLMAHQAKIDAEKLLTTGVKMKYALPALDIAEKEIELNETTFNAELAEISKSAAALIAERNAGLEFKQTFVKTFPNMSPEQVSQELTTLKNYQTEVTTIFKNQPLTEIIKVAAEFELFKQNLVATTLKYAGLLNMFDRTKPEIVASRKDAFSKMSLPELIELHETFTKAYEVEHPPPALLDKAPAKSIPTVASFSKSEI